MDARKTGSLIGERRKEQGLTQKQLAEMLNLSDRTVSKWERGAGFPDIALLEPLADALNLSVVDLLQGERKESVDPESSVRHAISLVYHQVKRQFRKNLVSMIAALFLLTACLWFFWSILEYNGVFLKAVSLEVPVTVYVNEEAVESGMITIDGKRGRNSFAGVFAIDYLERTTREGVQGYVIWGEEPHEYDTLKYFAYGGPWDCGIEHGIYISEHMTRVAIRLEDGTILATDEPLMYLMTLENYYPLDF